MADISISCEMTNDAGPDLLKQYPGRVRLLDQGISVETNKEFKVARHAFKLEVAEMDEDDREAFLEQAAVRLFGSEEYQEKKNILTQLSLLGNPKGHTLLQKFLSLNDPELGEWCALALLHSQMYLTEVFEGENYVYIATGLGGKNNLMRESMVLLAANYVYFSDKQRSLIEKECRFQMERMGGQVESLVIRDRYALLSLLKPLSISVVDMANTLLSAINEFETVVQCPGSISNAEYYTEEDCLGMVDYYLEPEPDF